MPRPKPYFWTEYLAGTFRSLGSLVAGIAQLKHEHNPPDRFLSVPSDGVKFDAPERLRVPSFLYSNAQLIQHDRADWQYVDPRIALFAARLVDAFHNRGIPLYVHGAFRTREQQEHAYTTGVSKARWPRAAHCQGKAVDIVHGVFHWEMSRDEWALLGKVGKALHSQMMSELPKDDRFEIVWGGDWSFYDPAHWEIKDWRDNIATHSTGPSVSMTPRHIIGANRK